MHCEKFYTHLAERGCHVTVFTRKPYVDPKLKKYRGINLVALGAHKSKFLEAIFHTAYAILRARLVHPDIVHIHAIGPSILALFARALGLRVVVTNHVPDYEKIVSLGSAPDEVIRMGKNARAMVEAEFNPALHYARLMEVYESAMAN